MDDLISRLQRLEVTPARKEYGYVYAVEGSRAVFFVADLEHPYCSRMLLEPAEKKYFDVNISRENLFLPSKEMSVRNAEIFTNRGAYSFKEAGYRKILESLLIGSRVRDFEQMCGTVVQRNPLIFTMPSVPVYLGRLVIRSVTGTSFEVIVDGVNRSNDKTQKVICLPNDDIPDIIKRGSRIMMPSIQQRTPIVTQSLMFFHRRIIPGLNWSLMERIYGDTAGFSSQPVDRSLIRVTKRDWSSVILNAEQSEAVRRYQSFCPAFAVESPPGSGKTMTASAMAVSYTGPGLQLFLSTANVPVYNMAVALDQLQVDHLNIIHLISADREAGMPELSPFSILQRDDDAADRFLELKGDLEDANRRKHKAIMNKMRMCHGKVIDASGDFDVILATVDMILCKLLKKKNPKHPCPIQRQLETRVRRIVIDEASQLTEAALNAIILHFPHAQICLIGDSKQLPPFKYQKGDPVSEMAAHSALDVLQRRKNVPVIRLLKVYRAAAPLIKHYSDVFYSGQLVSGKTDTDRVSLKCISPSVISRALMITVKNGVTERMGTSLINHKEISALEFLITKLRHARFDESKVMVIAFYEAQRKLAETRLPAGYEVLTVDSAQGREKEIVIVLTTRDQPTEGGFMNCPLRCNVAMSRHKEALIVLGHKTLMQSDPWSKLLVKEYFQMMEFN